MTLTTIDTSPRLTRFLRTIAADRSLHWRWLNTLSSLEHIGSRKIFRAKLEKHMNEMLLRHASEEARHALFFKTMARREADSTAAAPDALFCGASANRYFQSLDSAVRQYAGTRYPAGDVPYYCYLLTTWLIEVRAGQVYPLYQSVLAELGSSVTLKSIILEEEGHLAEMNAELELHNLTGAARELLETEAALFDRFLSKLEAQAGVVF